MMYFEINELKAEAQNRSILRTRHGGDPIRDEDDVTDYLKTAADEVYNKLQTLIKDYEFDSKIAYRMQLPETFDRSLIAVIYTLAKDYMVEGILKGWWEDTGQLQFVALSMDKQEKQMARLQQYRIQRIGGVKKTYTGL